MYDIDLVKEILRQILGASQTISRRFVSIKSPGDFSNSEVGREKLDAICMQLIAIGEGVKNLDKVTAGTLLPQYPQIEWKRIMGMRDVLSHQYFDLDADIVYAVCANRIGPLEQTVQNMIADIK